MRANRNAALAPDLAYNLALGDATPTLVGTPTLAQRDLNAWRTLLGQVLPGGTGAVLRRSRHRHLPDHRAVGRARAPGRRRRRRRRECDLPDTHSDMTMTYRNLFAARTHSPQRRLQRRGAHGRDGDQLAAARRRGHAVHELEDHVRKGRALVAHPGNRALRARGHDARHPFRRIHRLRPQLDLQANTLNTTGQLAWNFAESIRGYDYQSGTTWSPGLPAGMTSPAIDLNGSDALVLRVPAAADTSATLRLTDKMACRRARCRLRQSAPRQQRPCKMAR